MRLLLLILFSPIFLFAQSTDIDDLINGTVAFNGTIIENLTNGLNTFYHRPTAAGEITLTATLYSRGITYSNSTNIIVKNESAVGKFAAACIDYPAPEEYFTNSTVRFSAESTSGVICDGTSCDILPLNSSSLRYNWTRAEVDEKLKDIMSNIHDACIKYGKDEKTGYIDYVKGANIAGFVKVADAMLAQGVV